MCAKINVFFKLTKCLMKNIFALPVLSIQTIEYE